MALPPVPGSPSGELPGPPDRPRSRRPGRSDDESPDSAASTPRTYRLLDAAGRTVTSATQGTLGGHRGDRIYGRLDCVAAARALRQGGYRRHRVFFADELTAVSAGYRPCAVCLPAAYARWKAERAASASAHSPFELSTTPTWRDRLTAPPLL